MTNSLKHEDVGEQQMREKFAANAHLLTYCDVVDTFIAYPVAYDKFNGFSVTKLQIIEYFIGGTKTPRALIYRVTLDNGEDPIDTVRMFRVGDTVYNLLLN
jgi:hypothetical protein